MEILRRIERVLFFVSVGAALSAAVAGGSGWPKTAIVCGCLAAIFPILNRMISAHEQSALQSQLDRQAKSLAQIVDRNISAEQELALISILGVGPSFSAHICCNRREAEPSNFQEQLSLVFEKSGLQPKYWGGMDNRSVGIEVAGNDSEPKRRIMMAFCAAGIEFTEIQFADDHLGRWDPSVWIGTKPAPTI